MICRQTKLKIVDNSGAKLIKVFHLITYSGSAKSSCVGNFVLGSVIKHRANKKINKKQLCKVLIITTKKNYLRKNGCLIKFDENRGILINESTKLVGTRIFGPISKDVKKVKATRLLSLVSKIV